jgi:tetratricopeptide (TPR) repeat protein
MLMGLNVAPARSDGSAGTKLHRHLSLIHSEHQTMTRFIQRLDIVAAAAIVAIALSGTAYAAATEEPAKPVTAPSDKKPDAKSDTKSDAQPADGKAGDSKPADSKPAPDKKSENEFRDGYKQAYALIYKQHDYAGGIAVLKTLGYDDHPDVANLIGFSSRKLGHYDDAKVWYEKALAADPNHTRTWQYYGMWHLEQGNRLKAEDHLEQIRLICGQGCEDYKSLQGALEGNSTY